MTNVNAASILRRRVTLSALFCVVATSGYAAPDSPVRSLLQRSIEQAQFLEYSAITTQSCPVNGMTMFKVLNTSEGAQKMTVLSPLSMQGQAMLDDGKQWFNYIPDQNRVMVSPSPRLHYLSAKLRMDLAEKNYRLSLEKGNQIAGRDTVIITAVPKDGSLLTRRYVLDSKTALMLRLETLEKGKATVRWDTKAISFQEPGSLGVLHVTPVAGMRTITVKRDAPPTPATAPELPGIKVPMPSSLPNGFKLLEPQSVGKDGDRIVAIRMTDGLAMATAYLSKSASDIKHSFPGMNVARRNDKSLSVVVVSDSPSAVVERLAETFIRHSKKSS